jgi:hypothetical protein
MSNLPLFNEVTMVSACSQLAKDDADAAILSATSMITRIITVQQGINAPRHLAQPVLQALGGAIAGHVEARGSLLRAEAQLVRIAAKYGASPSAYGDSWPCPDEPKASNGDIPQISATA